jgi:eukaryotic-like serine/threonine-protein kinase
MIKTSSYQTSLTVICAGILGIGILLISSLLLQNVVAENELPLTYQNPDFGVSMQYPSDWIKDEDNLINNGIVAFRLANDSNTAEVNIKIMPLPPEQQNMTFDELSNIIIRSFKSDTSNQLINYSKITLNGKQALKLIYYEFGQSNFFSDILGNHPTTAKLIRIFVSPKASGLSYTYGVEYYVTQISKYDKFLPIAEKMINSIQITK